MQDIAGILSMTTRAVAGRDYVDRVSVMGPFKRTHYPGFPLIDMYRGVC